MGIIIMTYLLFGVSLHAVLRDFVMRYEAQVLDEFKQDMVAEGIKLDGIRLVLAEWICKLLVAIVIIAGYPFVIRIVIK